MKTIVIRSLPLMFLLLGAFTEKYQDIEFICMKKQMAPNTCHYNFKVDGGKFRYVDIGCRFKKTDEVIEKVKNGSLGLAKDWKIACPEMKEKKETDGY
jgi:hypothetical protein